MKKQLFLKTSYEKLNRWSRDGSDFELPPALAGEKGMNIKMALAKKNVILAKAIPYYPNFIPLAKAGGN